MRVQELAKEQEAYVIACRRHLHEHPELSTQEVETTKFIKAELEKMGKTGPDDEPERSGIKSVSPQRL